MRGPELASHLDVAFAVASGAAETGVAVRAAASLLGLDFVSLAWEPFDLALPASRLGSAAPLLDALADPATLARIEALGGYDLEDTGRVLRVA